MTSRVLSYDIPQIMACRESNMVLPAELVEYCKDKIKRKSSEYELLLTKVMGDITNSLITGVSPNDMMIMNMIRGDLNKINPTNYQEVLTRLKGLNYASEVHFGMLANELVIKAMNDMMAVKGLESNKNQISPSEIYVNIVGEFSSFFIEENDKMVKFKSVIAHTCQRYFKEFTDSKLKMDHNNQHRVNNYKGFMNLVGLLYSQKCFHRDIVTKCVKKIAQIITTSLIPPEELDNYYSGYERLINQVLHKFEDQDISADELTDFKELYEIIDETNKQITYSATDGKSIRKFSLMVHNQNIKRLEELKNKFN